jgi:predicted transcriptional regulator
MDRFHEGCRGLQGRKDMRVKNIKIAIKTREELFHEVEKVWTGVEKGEKAKKHEGLYFENLEAMRKVLTEERLRILKVVKQRQPSSIYALSKVLGRDTKNTFNDVKFLSEAGLIELKKSKDGRERTTPIVRYDKILLEISV